MAPSLGIEIRPESTLFTLSRHSGHGHTMSIASKTHRIKPELLLSGPLAKVATAGLDPAAASERPTGPAALDAFRVRRHIAEQERARGVRRAPALFVYLTPFVLECTTHSMAHRV